jgi:hypothetical protein
MAAVAPPTREAEPGLSTLLVVQPQAKLNGTRLVTLGVDGPKTCRTVETVGIAEIRAVEDIAQLSLEPQIEPFLQREDFEDVDVFVVRGECANRAVASRRVAEQWVGGRGIQPGICPRSSVEVILG